MAVINLMFFASTNDIGSLVTLLIVGFLTSFFSKNMIVILFISLVFTHILKYGTNINEGMENENFDSIEGMENEKKEKSDSTEEKKNVDTTEEKKTPKKSSEPMSDKNDVPNVKSLQKDFENFQSVQEQILTGMKAIDPLLTKAESFIEKFEKYKDREQFTNDDD
jgi:cytoskeletal protein RodZ